MLRKHCFFRAVSGVVRDHILVINAGSSSIKFTVFDSALSAALHGQVEGIGSATRLKVTDAQGGSLADRAVTVSDHQGAIASIHDWFVAHVGSEVGFAGAAHRIVHGGTTYADPALIDDRVIAELEMLVPLAPLHQPHSLAAIRAIKTVAPHLPQVACFDTAFHRSQPPVAQEFALPRELTDRGVRRYGFHGLSYEYVVSVLARLAPECAEGKVVIAHLGNGASMCAIERGRSVATTMGFTPLDGLMMGTRTGALDPGVVLYLLQHEQMDATEIQTLLYERCGLLGVSGLSSDMRALLASDLAAAKQAVDLFVYRIGRELGSLAAALGGLDALVFTGGIGENAAEIRARICRDAEWLGIRLDEPSNAVGRPCISGPGSRVSAWIVPTDENLMIAQHTRRLLGSVRE